MTGRCRLGWHAREHFFFLITLLQVLSTGPYYPVNRHKAPEKRSSKCDFHWATTLGCVLKIGTRQVGLICNLDKRVVTFYVNSHQVGEVSSSSLILSSLELSDTQSL